MSDRYLIDGGSPLHGEVFVGGAKNSALKLLAASLLAPGTHVLRRVPRIVDVLWMVEVLRHLGADADWTGPNELTVAMPAEPGVEAPYEFVSRMRASIVVLGPLVARTGGARVALPGGCNLGPRGIDQHLRGLEQLGARLTTSHGFVEATCRRLRGARVRLNYPSHTATENLLMASVLAEGTTVIDNASREPEILDLVGYLSAMGARISGAGTSVIEIEGVDELRPAAFEVMPDRLEAGTFMFAAAAAGGDVIVRDMVPEHLEIVIEKLRECGAKVEVGGDAARVVAEGRPLAADISTLPYPGFPTDLMALAVAYLARADGLSIVTENIFDSRYMFADELVRMGADIKIEGHYCIVRGVAALSAAPVRAADLRAGAALVLAALAADGTTVIDDVLHIDRGYQDLDGRLAALGARIRREGAGTGS